MAYVMFVLKSGSGVTSVLPLSHYMQYRKSEIYFSWKLSRSHRNLNKSLRKPHLDSSFWPFPMMLRDTGLYSFRELFLAIQLLCLVDSGSSASFLATSVANQFPQLQRTPMASSVKVANGHLLRCTSVILGYQFHLGEHIF
jgi:hypothetical protein